MTDSSAVFYKFTSGLNVSKVFSQASGTTTVSGVSALILASNLTAGVSIELGQVTYSSNIALSAPAITFEASNLNIVSNLAFSNPITASDAIFAQPASIAAVSVESPSLSCGNLTNFANVAWPTWSNLKTLTCTSNVSGSNISADTLAASNLTGSTVSAADTLGTAALNCSNIVSGTLMSSKISGVEDIRKQTVPVISTNTTLSFSQLLHGLIIVSGNPTLTLPSSQTLPTLPGITSFTTIFKGSCTISGGTGFSLTPGVVVDYTKILWTRVGSSSWIGRECKNDISVHLEAQTVNSGTWNSAVVSTSIDTTTLSGTLTTDTLSSTTSATCALLTVDGTLAECSRIVVTEDFKPSSTVTSVGQLAVYPGTPATVLNSSATLTPTQILSGVITLNPTSDITLTLPNRGFLASGESTVCVFVNPTIYKLSFVNGSSCLWQGVVPHVGTLEVILKDDGTTTYVYPVGSFNEVVNRIYSNVGTLASIDTNTMRSTAALIAPSMIAGDACTVSNNVSATNSISISNHTEVGSLNTTSLSVGGVVTTSSNVTLTTLNLSNAGYTNSFGNPTFSGLTKYAGTVACREHIPTSQPLISCTIYATLPSAFTAVDFMKGVVMITATSSGTITPPSPAQLEALVSDLCTWTFTVCSTVATQIFSITGGISSVRPSYTIAQGTGTEFTVSRTGTNTFIIAPSLRDVNAVLDQYYNSNLQLSIPAKSANVSNLTTLASAAFAGVVAPTLIGDIAPSTLAVNKAITVNTYPINILNGSPFKNSLGTSAAPIAPGTHVVSSVKPEYPIIWLNSNVSSATTINISGTLATGTMFYLLIAHSATVKKPVVMDSRMLKSSGDTLVTDLNPKLTGTYRYVLIRCVVTTSANYASQIVSEFDF